MTFQPTRTLDVGEVTPFSPMDGEGIDNAKYRRSTRRATGELAEERLGWCSSTFIYTLDPHKGRYCWRLRVCGRKDCPVCGVKRGRELAERVTKALQLDPDLLYVYLPTMQAATYRKHLADKRVYLSIPIDAFTDLLIYQPTTDIRDGEVVTTAFIESTDWTTLQLTPDNRNLSGHLGLHLDSTPAHIDGVVFIPELLFSPDVQSTHGKQIQQAQLDSDTCTVGLLPKTIKDLQAAINLKFETFTTLLTKFDVQYKTTHAKRYIDLRKLDWSGNAVDATKTALRRDSNSEEAFNDLAWITDELSGPYISEAQQLQNQYS
jgi:hypothetical protein